MIALVSLPAALKELNFAAGLPGFPSVRKFDWVRWGGPDSPFVVLTGQDRRKIQFVLVTPESYFPDYRPEFSAEHVSAIGLDHQDDAVVMVMVTLRVEPGGATANLLGPLLINPLTGQAVQAVLWEGGWDTRAPLPPAGPPSGNQG